MYLPNKNKGFTLIELVVVIVILGILAATALPKFINLQKEARIATLEGLKGAIVSAAEMVHSKAIIDNQLDENGTIENGGDSILLTYGYPVVYDQGIILALDDNIITNLTKPTNGEWVSDFEVTVSSAEAVFSIADLVDLNITNLRPGILATECYIRYNAATEDEKYLVSMVTDGC